MKIPLGLRFLYIDRRDDDIHSKEEVINAQQMVHESEYRQSIPLDIKYRIIQIRIIPIRIATDLVLLDQEEADW